MRDKVNYSEEVVVLISMMHAMPMAKSPKLRRRLLRGITNILAGNIERERLNTKKKGITRKKHRARARKQRVLMLDRLAIRCVSRSYMWMFEKRHKVKRRGIG
ncbi:hypothetical protein NVP2275O_169 [Vibrio phage 2.275.O._10N.286.54.E11]|nr:hypothetical protein NVP2275O_169 [Vibrio phage 2.275.O._10N.286.54.E11]